MKHQNDKPNLFIYNTIIIIIRIKEAVCKTVELNIYI